MNRPLSRVKALVEATAKRLGAKHICTRFDRVKWERCLLPMRTVVSEAGDVIGLICTRGHVTSVKRRPRLACRTCGSRTNQRHATGCLFAYELITTALVCADDIATFRGSATDTDFADDAWFEVQEAIEEVLPFGDSRIGGPL